VRVEVFFQVNNDLVDREPVGVQERVIIADRVEARVYLVHREIVVVIFLLQVLDRLFLLADFALDLRPVFVLIWENFEGSHLNVLVVQELFPSPLLEEGVDRGELRRAKRGAFLKKPSE